MCICTLFSEIMQKKLDFKYNNTKYKNYLVSVGQNQGLRIDYSPNLQPEAIRRTEDLKKKGTFWFC